MDTTHPSPTTLGHGSSRAWLRAIWGVFAGAHGRGWQVAMWMITGLIVLRALAPWALTMLVNRSLQRPGYLQGSVSGISLGLLSGDYAVHGVRLTVADEGPGGSGRRVPLLELDHLRCAFSWTALIHGRLEGTVRIDHPVLHLGPPVAKQAPEAAEPLRPDHWQNMIRGMIRFRIAALEISEGRFAYDDPQHDAHASVGAIQGYVHDLIVPAGSQLPATFSFAATTIGNGALTVNGQARVGQDKPQLNMHVALEHLDLPQLNPLSVHYDGLIFKAGSFSAYLEAQLDGELISGYVKPIFKDLDITSYHAETGGAASKLFWKAVVPVAEDILENSDRHQQAARIPITGTVVAPATDVWSVVGSSLSNAFIRAILPGFEGG